VSLRGGLVSSLVPSMLDSPGRVEWFLEAYTDWWQPPTTSMLQVAAARRSSDVPDGFQSGLLETLDERTELRRRVWMLHPRERKILFLWYIKQASPEEVARAAGMSRRHFFRCRGKAIQAIVDFGRPQEAAS
jgi:hypothetical protein